MPTSLRENGEHSAAQHTVPAVPDTNGQIPLFPASLSLREHVRWVCRNHMKAVGMRIWGGEPEQGLSNLAHVLDPRLKKRFDIDWLLYVVEVIGRPASDYVLGVLCELWGYEAPVRKADPIRVEEQLDRMDERVEALVKANNELIGEMRAMREGRR